jgi:uncharacterized membrane protein YraQ (UPF0718 family)
MELFYAVYVFAQWVTHQVFAIPHGTLLADAVSFFIFDTIKLSILLTVIIFFVSLLRSFMPAEKIRKLLSRKYQLTGNLMAAAFGIITPFCTCSAIPLFLGFLDAGVPLGATFSFLIASPMINEVAIVLLLGLFGWKTALIYVMSGYLIAVFSGFIIGNLSLNHLVEHLTIAKKNVSTTTMHLTWANRVNSARVYTQETLANILPYIVLGIGVGAWIHGYVPTDFIAQYAHGGSWYAVPLATIIGIPLYSNVAGVLPLVSVLTEKGVAIGTTLAFMMAVTGLSLPEFLILKNIMKTKLIIIFASIVGLGILFTGYLFNFLLQ